MRRSVGLLMAVVSCGVQGLVALLMLMTQAQAQPVAIPLQYYYSSQGSWSLGITIGINGGTPQPYLFDTGSNLFNAAWNPATWGGFGSTVPNSTVPKGQNQYYCYGSEPCYRGNIVQVPLLSFYAAGATAGSTPAASLSASLGYQISAVYESINSNTMSVTQRFPNWMDDGKGPPLYGIFYGIFGTGNFASTSSALNSLNGSTTDGPIVGGVFGQTVVANVMHQGFVVSANGQPNPSTYRADGTPIPGTPINGPSGNQIVTIGGRQQQVSPCTACVTVGLSPELIGQFQAVSPTSQAGVVPIARPGPDFPNPYSSGAANPGSTEFGARFTTVLVAPNGTTTTDSPFTLLDSGTEWYALSKKMENGSNGGTLTIAGATALGTTLANVPITTSTVGGNGLVPPSSVYYVTFSSGQNILGIPFFMQNSVMFDLTAGTIGYTPFYVTTANLATTANGPLIVGGNNVPLGLAGVVSGPGGVTVNAGGAIQFSATNTYTGPTTIAGPSGGTSAGALLVSGPGSIASSSGVTNNGFFDISRAWAPVSIQTLSGNGQVYLGGGNLVLANASGTYSGTISDGGSYNVAGGSLTLAGGNFTLAGLGNYTGGTYVTGGNFTLSGNLLGALVVQPGGSFTIAPGGVLNNFGAGTVNGGQLTVGGTLAGNVFNTGITTVNGLLAGSIGNMGVLGGSGTISGNVGNAGTIAPGNSIGTLNIGGNFGNTSSGVYSAEVNGSGQSDLVNVGGTAILQGGTVYVYAQPGTTYAPRTTYRILNAAGGVNGTFNTVNELYPFLLSSLSYDANNAYLTLQIGGFTAAAVTPTQYAVGAVLDANVNNATGDFAQVLSAMATGIQTDQAAQYALQSLSGNNYAGFSSTMVQGAQLFMNNFASQAGGGGSPTSTRVAVAEACDVACDMTSPPKWGAWGGGLGGLGTIGGNSSVGAITYNAGGFATGLDRLVTDSLRIGVTAGYASGTQWVSGFSGVGRSDTFQTGLYANFAQDKVYADALIGYAYTWNQMWRQITIPGLQPRTALGLTGVNQFYGQIETGYRIDLGTNAQAFVTPFARLQAYTGNQNGFTESGAQSLNLTVAQQTTNSLRTVLGAQVGGAMDLGWREKLAMVLRLGWSHEYADTSRPVTATLAGAPAMPFTTWGISPQRDGVVIGLSANTAIAEATSIYFRYEGNISGQDNAQAFTAGLRMTW